MFRYCGNFQILRGVESNMLMYKYIVHVCTVFPERKGDKSNTAFGGAYPNGPRRAFILSRELSNSPIFSSFQMLMALTQEIPINLSSLDLRQILARLIKEYDVCGALKIPLNWHLSPAIAIVGQL